MFDKPVPGRVLKMLWNENHEITHYIVEYVRQGNIFSPTMDNNEKYRFFLLEDFKKLLCSWEGSSWFAGPEPYEFMYRSLIDLHPFDFCVRTFSSLEDPILLAIYPESMYASDERENLFVGTATNPDQPIYTKEERQTFKEAIEKIIYPSRFINFRAFQALFKGTKNFLISSTYFRYFQNSL